MLSKFHFPIAIACKHQSPWQLKFLLLLTFLFFLMGHVASRFAPLDPDLEAKNQLLDLVPQLMDELLRQGRPEPRPQSTSILTGRGYVEEILNGNNYSF
jgi:hypothetical protein